MPRPDLSASEEQALRARAKAELRERMRSLRRVMPQTACAERSAAICARLCELEEFERASSLAGYAAYRKEADPSAALARAEHAGKRIGLVRIEQDGRLGMRRHRTGEPLIENAFGILEPAPEAEALALGGVQLIVVPALAIDARGYRIGYGHGYYDRLLPELPAAFKVAIGYDFQLLSELPNTDGDAAVDCIVTDRRTLRVAG